MNHYDVAIIGGGAAGLSAALVLTRAGRNVVVLDSQSPRNAPATHMHGFLSRDGMNPADLLTAGRVEVHSYGGTIRHGVVNKLTSRGAEGFSMDLVEGESFAARKVLVATGLRDELPDIPGLAERWARDVLHCPYCHGHEVADRRLGVIGTTSGAVRYAQIVRQWSPDVVFFAPHEMLTTIDRAEFAARGIGVVEGDIEQVIVADDRLVGVHMSDGCTVPRDALFVPPRFIPNDEFLLGLGCTTNDAGWVTADSAGGTSVPGVWAAGNVVDPRAQVITAAGAGSAAAIAINTELVEDDVRQAVRARDDLPQGMTAHHNAQDTHSHPPHIPGD